MRTRKNKKEAKATPKKIIDVYFSANEKDMLGLVFPMTKDPAILERKWTETVERVWEKLKEGKDVAFVTEGDPMLYSTFIHMMRLMQERHPEAPIQVIPGISSINGAASRLGIPLADGDEHVAIVPAREDYETMKKVLVENDCVIFIKVAKVIDFMVGLLKELDLLEKASVVTKVTSDEEIIWKASELEGADLQYLTLMVVRK